MKLGPDFRTAPYFIRHCSTSQNAAARLITGTNKHQTCPSRTTLTACWVTDYAQSSAHHFHDYPWTLSSLLVIPPSTTTRNEADAYPLNYFLPSILWTLWHTVNMPFLSPHLYYGTVYRILLKIQHLFHLLNLPSKHSCFGSFVFDLFYE